MAMEQDKWLDISDEVYREYVYPEGDFLRIESPTELRITPSSMGGHSHRVKTANGYAYYVAPGWRAIPFGPGIKKRSFLW